MVQTEQVCDECIITYTLTPAYLVLCDDQRVKWNEWCLRAMFMHCKAVLGITSWTNEIKIVMNHAPGAGSIARHMLTSNPVRYHCTTDVSEQRVSYYAQRVILTLTVTFRMSTLQDITTNAYDYADNLRILCSTCIIKILVTPFTHTHTPSPHIHLHTHTHTHTHTNSNN